MSQRKDLGVARRELERAQNCILMMRDGSAFNDFPEVWREFLYRLQRSVIKVQAHFISNHKFKTWDGSKQNEISSDTWLQYLKQSRNSEEHRIEVVSEVIPGGYKIGIPSERGADVIIENLVFEEGRLLSYRGNAPISYESPRVILKDVVNRGVTYKPPFYDAVRDLNSSLSDECQKAIEYYRSYIDEAERFLSKFHED